MLGTALRLLPTEQRVVVVLRYFDDYSEAQTAAVLGIPQGTVKSRCARGLDQLRRLLGPQMETV